MNGFQALLFSDVATKGLYTQSKQLPGSRAEKNAFFQLLADKTINNGEDNALSQHLLAVAQQLGEQLTLDEAAQDQLLNFVQSLIDDTQLIETIDEQLIESFIIPISQYLEEKTGMSKSDIAGKLLATLKLNDDLEPILTHQLAGYNLMFNLVNHQTPLQLNMVSKLGEQEQLQSAHRILQHFFTMMADADLEMNLQRQGPTLLKLLDQWQSLNKNVKLLVAEEHRAIDKNLTKLWDELYSRYSKRTNALVQSAYHHDSKVNSQDIVNWIKHLAPNLLQNVQSIQQIQALNDVIMNPTMQSPIEQYVIYTKVADGENSVRDQLMNQFRQIMKTSQFTASQPGVNQLSMTLKPSNLGEMLVRFVEMNGEMTVRILVTSQATKSILEGNIHQLKHMFAPHQVLIEKVDEGQNLIVKDESLQEDADSDQDHEAAEEHKDEQYAEQDGLDFGQLLNNYI